MTQIITFFSPKTAGASSLILNAACLHKLSRPTQKVGLIEFSPTVSQQVLFPMAQNHTWEELWPFYKTKEWNSDLLGRVKFDLGVEILWSPVAANFPSFNKEKAMAFMDLAMARYDVIYIDLNQGVDSPWKEFVLSQSTQVVGVVCADPLGISAWSNWVANISDSVKKGLVINQVAASESLKIKAKFKSPELAFIETVPVENKLLWQQVYLQFPVVWHKRSAYKNSVSKLISYWMKA